nr:MAG TPA: baseplate protein [Caudoviricetes sp.]
MITLNFDEVLKRIYNAKKGVEVRYGLGQGFEYCKQFADEAQGHAINAKASADKAAQTVAGIEQTKTDAVQAVQNAQTTATAAITQTKDAALTDIGNAKTGALQEVSNSTQAAETAANAAGNAATAAGGYASSAESSATAASGSASAAATSESNAASSAQSAGTDADRAEAAAALAGTRANTDKTLKTENAPADAAAVGNIILDPDGNVIFYSKTEVEAKIKEMLAAQREEDLARIKFWASDDPTSPASFIGGTWERIEGKFIMGASDTYPAGSTGGSATHVQTVDEIAPHTHNYNGYNKVGNGTPYLSGGNGAWEQNVPTGDTGGGKPMDILNPYYSAYIWRRVA